MGFDTCAVCLAGSTSISFPLIPDRGFPCGRPCAGGASVERHATIRKRIIDTVPSIDPATIQPARNHPNAAVLEQGAMMLTHGDLRLYWSPLTG